jgi:hypothetical protein
MFKLFLVILAILLPAILLMGYRVFFTKSGKFPNTHVEGNKAMRQRGIGCVKSQDRAEQKRKNILEIE